MKTIKLIIRYFLLFGWIAAILFLVLMLSTPKDIEGPVEVTDPIYTYSQEVEIGSYAYCDLVFFEPLMKLEDHYSNGVSLLKGYYYYGLSKDLEIVYFYVSGGDSINNKDPLAKEASTVNFDNPYRLTGVIEEHPELLTTPTSVSYEELLRQISETPGDFDLQTANEGAKSTAVELANAKILTSQNLLGDGKVIDEENGKYIHTEIMPIGQNTSHYILGIIALVIFSVWIVLLLGKKLYANKKIDESLSNTGFWSEFKV